MPYTYPAPPATVASDATTVEVHHFMKTPSLIARRLRDLLLQRYIADFLLTGRFVAQGGAILYETGEEIFPQDDPRSVAPGAAYPVTPLTAGELAAAKTVKWGQDSIVTDESIARLLMNPVERALTKLANGNVRQVDSVALGVIASKITSAIAASGLWSGVGAGARIIEDTLRAKAAVTSLDEGFEPNVITLRDTQFASVVARLIVEGYLPREARDNTLATGVVPDVLGLTWARTNHAPSSGPMLVDNTQLGGMADELLGSPGYVSSGNGVGVEVKTIRDDDKDRYKVRARRVTVPVVLEPRAGVFITGTV